MRSIFGNGMVEETEQPKREQINRKTAWMTAAFLIPMVAVGMGRAQTPAPSPAGNDGAAARDSRVTVDVVVSDTLGHPIRGLQAGDFTLLDNKTPRKLLSFREVDARNSPDDPVHVVIVVDMINTGFNEVAREREELDRFLKQDGGELANPTSIAVFAENGIKVEQGASRDGNELAAVLAKAQTALRTEGRDTGFWGATDRFDMSLKQLRQLAAYEATRPGRKMILVISPGWPLLSWSGEEASMKAKEWVFNTAVQFTNGLREAGITLYCIDPYELGRTDPFYYQSFLKPVTEAKNATYPNISLQVLAEHSGGRVLISGRDILGELNTAVRDASASYELTFKGAPGDKANEYHALQVQVDKPDVKVHAATGYYARTAADTAGH